ncbi:MAG: DUF4411 family protein [Anaerolineaceae bacterium]
MSDKFLLDSSILISASKAYFPFDIAPSFWNQLVEKGLSGMVVFSDEVKKEIYKQQDELTNWLTANEENFQEIKSSDSKVVNCYSDVINSVAKDQIYRETAKREFAMVADSWLIATAIAYGLVVVTNETYEEACKKSVKIPNVCKVHQVKCIDLMQFLRTTGFLFP